MSSPLHGVQFPLHPQQQKISSAYSGRCIVAAALESVNCEAAQQVHAEKNWRKQYPIHFKNLVQHALSSSDATLKIAEAGLQYAQQHFEFYRDGRKYRLSDVMSLSHENLHRFELKGESQQDPEWYVPYQGQQLQGRALLAQIQRWEDDGIIETSHAHALRSCVSHPEWFDLSDRTTVLFGAASEAGPLTWLAKWKANIIALDLPNERVWNKIISTVKTGNATLIAPCLSPIQEDASDTAIMAQLGVNFLTHIPEIGHWLTQFEADLDLAAIAYLDGEKHVRVSMAMDAIMGYVSQQKANTSLMYMCTPTDVYAVPEEIMQASHTKYQQRSKLHAALSKGLAAVSKQAFFKENDHTLYPSGDAQYGIRDCLVVEQGPNYALAKRLQQWRATLARQNGQRVSINIAPSTTTHSVTKNPLLKAAFTGASLFDVEAFAPETTNALMAALWIYDLRHPRSVANPEVKLNHPLDLIMSGANHGGLWRVAYLARTALPFAAVYGFSADKLPKGLLGKLKK